MPRMESLESQIMECVDHDLRRIIDKSYRGFDLYCSSWDGIREWMYDYMVEGLMPNVAHQLAEDFE